MEQSLPHDQGGAVQRSPSMVPPPIEPVGLDALTVAVESVVEGGLPAQVLNEGSPGPVGLYDHFGKEICVLCRARLNRKDKAGRVKPQRAHGDGHAHDSCIKRERKRTTSEVADLVDSEPPIKRQRFKDPEQHEARHRATGALESITRTVKPYVELQRAQRTERHAIVSDVLRGLSMTLDDLLSKFILSSDKCAAFDNHQLKALRDVFPLPSHTHINKKRVEMAQQYGCGTSAFSTKVRGESQLIHVAYITDPVTLMQHFKDNTAKLNKDSKWKCVVGVDKGGDLTKIGITYPTDRIERNKVVWDFLPFVITTGNDDWDGLSVLHSSMFQFSGLTTGYSDYHQYLQALLNDPAVCFGGDWNSINAAFGLSTASASYPCFACTVHLRNLLTIAPPRTEDQVAINTLYVLDHPSTVPNMNHSLVRLPHLIVPFTRIVPTPLHVFLGLANRLVDGFVDYTSVEFISSLRAEVKGHAEPTGASNIYALNGPQLAKWIKGGYTDRVVQEYLRSHSEIFSLKVLIRIRTAGEWMKQLHDYLLHSREWTSDEIVTFGQLKDSMWKNWTKITGDAPTPKLHMLQHCVEFATRHHFLGRYSEAQLESCHADANRAYEQVHQNKINDPQVRVKRTLVTLITKQVIPRRPKRGGGRIAA
jgi:hypothetical protein